MSLLNINVFPPLKRRFLLLRVYGVSLGIVGVYIIVNLFAVYQSRLIFFVAFGGIFLAGYGLVKANKFLPFCSHLYIVCSYLLITLTVTRNGGLAAPGIVWFLVCPLIAYLILPATWAVVWLMIAIGTLAAFYFFPETLVLEPFREGRHMYLVTFSLFFFFVHAITRLFFNEVRKGAAEQETLNELLKVKQHDLEVSQKDLIHQHELLKKAESRAVARSRKLGFYLDQLLEVNRMEELHAGNLVYAIQAIQQFLIRTMDLENVAVWHLHEDRISLMLIGSKGDEETMRLPLRLTSEDFPDAYQILECGALVVTSKSDPTIQQLHVCFPNSEDDSLIACPYFMEGTFAGFFCCRSKSREWSEEDVIFTRAISDTLQQVFKSYQRKRQQELLSEKQRQIEYLNGSLEQKVLERTEELNAMNKQLLDFAFINAHEIRGPVCRLLGLRNLLSLTGKPEEIIDLAKLMGTSIQELDEITRKATQLLEQATKRDEGTKES